MPRGSKKKTEEPEESKKPDASEAREARKAKKDADTFTYVGEPEKNLPPQAAAILNIVKEAGKKGISRKDLVAAMEGVVTTRQPLSRILTYYQKRLVEEECVELTESGSDD